MSLVRAATGTDRITARGELAGPVTGDPVTVGWPPAPGDIALVNRVSSPDWVGERRLRVDAVEPCPDPSWAWLTGRWLDDGTSGRVLVWLDRLLVHKVRVNPTTVRG